MTDMAPTNGEQPPMSWERVAHLARHLDSPSAPPPMRQTARDLAVTARLLYAENARLRAALSAKPPSDGHGGMGGTS